MLWFASVFVADFSAVHWMYAYLPTPTTPYIKILLLDRTLYPLIVFLLTKNKDTLGGINSNFSIRDPIFSPLYNYIFYLIYLFSLSIYYCSFFVHSHVHFLSTFINSHVHFLSKRDRPFLQFVTHLFGQTWPTFLAHNKKKDYN